MIVERADLGGMTQARQRLGYEPMKKLFAEVAVPVAEELTTGAFLGPRRLMAIDGFEWDAPIPKRMPPRSGSPGRGLITGTARRTRRCRPSRSASAPPMRRWTRAIGGVAGKGAGEQSVAASCTGGWTRTSAPRRLLY